MKQGLTYIKKVKINGKVAKIWESTKDNRIIFLRNGKVRIKVHLIGSNDEIIRIAKSIK